MARVRASLHDTPNFWHLQGRASRNRWVPVYWSREIDQLQTMGELLRETGYFSWWFSQQQHADQAWLEAPLSEIAIAKAVNEYMVRPTWQIEQGLIWLKRKEKIAGNDTVKLLRLWNGDITGKRRYAEAVLGRLKTLRLAFDRMTADKLNPQTPPSLAL